jgi:hypothetical protein
LSAIFAIVHFTREIPMSISNEIVFPGGVVQTKVFVPTIMTCMVDIGEKMAPSVCVQWFGEYNYPCTRKDAQFFFDTGISPHHCLWMDKIETFQVIFMGPIKNWVYPSDINRLISMNGWTLNTTILWSMSPYSLNEGVPSSLIMRLTLANNPKYKDVVPKLYFDQSIKEKVLSEIETKNPISIEIDNDDGYGFEVKRKEPLRDEMEGPEETDVWED